MVRSVKCPGAGLDKYHGLRRVLGIRWSHSKIRNGQVVVSKETAFGNSTEGLGLETIVPGLGVVVVMRRAVRRRYGRASHAGQHRPLHHQREPGEWVFDAIRGEAGRTMAGCFHRHRLVLDRESSPSNAGRF